MRAQVHLKKKKKIKMREEEREEEKEGGEEKGKASLIHIALFSPAIWQLVFWLKFYDIENST